jgi:putative DNA primase/helicase
MIDPKDEDELLSPEEREHYNARAHSEDPQGRVLDCVPLSEIEPEEVEWLWRARIPRGKVTLLVGDPGGGKSYATLAIAGSVTSGTTLPDDDEKRTPRRVLMWNGEDGLEDTIRPRAEKAGVCLERLRVIRGTLDEDKKPRPFGLTDLQLVAQELERLGDVAMVVVDPIASLLAGTDSHRDTEVRSALQPLADLARLYRVAVLVVMHLRKAEAERAVYRIGGSIGFVGLARSVLLAGVDPESGRRAITPIKSSLCAPPPPIEYSIDEKGIWRWGDIAKELTAEHLLRAPARQRQSEALDEAQAFLEEMLSSGPCPSREVEAEAKKRGISESTLKRARETLGVDSKRVGGAGKNGRWMLSLRGSSNETKKFIEPLSKNLDTQGIPPKEAISSIFSEDDTLSDPKRLDPPRNERDEPLSGNPLFHEDFTKGFNGLLSDEPLNDELDL